MHKIKSPKFKWLIVLTAILAVGLLLVYIKFASATFQGNGGNIAWGDTGTGRIRLSHSTWSNTSPYSSLATSFRPATAPDASAINFVANKTSPNRTEKLQGSQLNDGKLYISTCSGTCTALGDLTVTGGSTWNQTIYGSGKVVRGFDIAYEQLSGRAMVVYAGNTTGKLYYCIFDGTSWGPVSSCAPDTAGHTNEISLTDGSGSLSGTPEWVRLVPQGGQFTDNRTNSILLAVGDTNQDYFVTRWTGTAWSTTDRQVLTTTGGSQVATTDSGNQDPAAYDVAWETTSGTEMAVYADGTNFNYRTSTGSGWSSATTIQTFGTAAAWIRANSDPQSNRLSAVAAFSGTVRPYIWKTDNTTASWTVGTSNTLSQNVGENVDTAWMKGNPVSGTATPIAMFSGTNSTNTQRTYYETWTQSGGFSSWANMNATNVGDNIVSNELTASPNSDAMNIFLTDRDGKLRSIFWNGTAWGSLMTSAGGATMSIINTPTTRANNKSYTQKAYQYTFTPYSPWSLNWRVYDDETTAGDPGTALAAQDTQATVKPNNAVRLRMNIAELSGGSQADVRKKLQYSSGAGCPDSTTCSWTDVDAQGGGGIWRYYNGGATDDSSIGGALLTGTTDLGRYYENGTAASTDAPGAGSTTEYDFTIQNNGATIGTTYYFRAYDYGPTVSTGSRLNINAIYRLQKLNSSGTEATSCSDGTNAITCTYPTLLSYTAAPQAPVWISVPGGTSTPLLQLKSSDGENDYIDYVIEWCTANSWPCAATGGVFCQLNVAVSPTCTGDQSNWSGMDANSGTAYNGSSDINISTTANFQMPAGNFQPNTTYYLRAKAIDPGGSNTYGLYSATTSTTTSAVDILIRGGTCIGATGSGTACSAQTSRGASVIKIGN